MWLGIVSVWGGLLVLVLLLAPDWLTAAIVMNTVAAVVAGVVITRSRLSRNQSPVITPMDLRRR